MNKLPLTLSGIQSGLKQKHFSSVEITTHLLERIHRLNPSLGAFITITDEHALKQATEADHRRSKGDAHPLLGIPLAHKDLFCTKNILTTCGSKMLQGFKPPYDASVVERFNQVGCVTLGKLNMDEFAMGSSSESSFFGAVHNPWDIKRTAGGSSGGSASAVAAELVPIATGTDTGGSIRQPAAMTNISGIKPTYGRVSRWGMIAYASSLDQGGVMAWSAQDCALGLNVIAGFDARDSTSQKIAADDYCSSLDQPLNQLKIGVPKIFFDKQLSSGIGDCVMEAIGELQRHGATLVALNMSHLEFAVAAYYVIATAEASSNLSRYDGVRFGHRCQNPSDLNDLFCRSRSEGFGTEVKNRILVGAYALSAGYYDAYYLKALKVRRLIRDDFLKAFDQVDVIMGPTSPTTAWHLGEYAKDPMQAYLQDIYTVPANLAGIPAMSIPCGMNHGLPVGLQIMAPHFKESLLLNVAHQFQKLTDWHSQRPIPTLAGA